MRAVLPVLSLALLTAIAVAQELPEGAVLVGHWALDDGDGQWAGDTGEFGHSGILGTSMAEDASDPTWAVEGHVGGCLRFDGDTDRVTLANSAALAPVTGLIVEAWVRQAERTPFARVLDKGSTFDIYIHENGQASFRLRGAEADGVRSPTPVPLDEWTSIRGEVYAGRMRLLINGEVVAEREYAEAIEDAGQDLLIGSAQNARPFDGLIDEVRYWNVGYEPPAALQPAEPTEHTVGLWRLDAERVIDASGTQAEGELVNGQVVAGRVGQAMRFHGDGWARIAADPSLDLTEQITIDAWVHQQQRGPYARIVEKSDWAWGVWITTFGNVDFFFKTADGMYHHTVSLATVPLRRWTHVRATFDGFQAAVFINGEESVRDQMPPAQDMLLTSDGDLYIGNRHLGDRGFVGMIDDVHISGAVADRPPLALVIDPLPSLGHWDLRASARGLADPVDRIEVRVTRDADGSEMLALTIDQLSRGVGTGRMDIDPQPGDYTVVATALGEDRAPLAEERREITVPDARPWLEAKAGETDEVLPPWTPIEVSEEEGAISVECWGRRHELGGGALPESLTSAGAELLAGPCTLTSGGEASAWRPPRVEERSDAKVVLSAEGLVGGTALSMRTTIEFDGMVRYDLTVSPAEGGGPTDLVLRVPLAAEHATLMHHPGDWFGDETCAGAVPQGRWEADSQWYLWVGDEDRGLCWFAEDQATWPIAPGATGIDLVPEGDARAMQVWLISAEEPLAQPRTFTWGLMATPVKPLPEDRRVWRFGSLSSGANVAVQWSIRGLSEWHSFPVPVEPVRYHALADAAHEEGVRIVPYTNFNMQSDQGEAWGYYGAEWFAHAGKGTAADVLRMGVVNMRCCPLVESWQDFITWQYQRFLAEYGWDGYYLDNSIPGKCNNPYHPDSHHGRWMIFGTRELMKRFYAITKADDPRNVMVCHMSTRLCIPLLSFCDAYVDGEQYHWALNYFDGDYISLTGLPRVRAEFTGRQWGLIPLFLPELGGASGHKQERTRELLALLLPHGTRFWAGACDIPTLNAALDALEEFGLTDARFLPYWSSGDVLAVAQPEAIASAYARDGAGAVLVVSNLADEEREVAVEVDLQAIGIDGEASAGDVLDGGEVTLAGTALTVSVPARDFRLIRLTRE